MNQVLDTLLMRQTDIIKIFEHYGEAHQLFKVAEELCECAAAINRDLRKHFAAFGSMSGEVVLSDASYEEAADSLLSLMYVCLKDPKKVSKGADRKADRTLKGIGSEVQG